MIEGVKTRPLKVLPDERGMLMEMLRSDWPEFQEFGQLYVTSVYPGVVKAWHMHEKQTDHFVCVSGMARVAIHDDREGSATKGRTDTFFIGREQPLLLVIPARLWHGFTAVGTEPAAIVNVPTELYQYDDPDEHRRPHDDPTIGYDWGVRDG